MEFRVIMTELQNHCNKNMTVMQAFELSTVLNNGRLIQNWRRSSLFEGSRRRAANF
jgi:hypothetical protein